MGFAHLSGREPQHPENRDQMGRGLFHIKIWTLESLAFLFIGVVNYRDRYRPVYCFVSSQAGFQTQCHWNCFKKAFNINDLALIVMDWLCRDTLPSRALRDMLDIILDCTIPVDVLWVQCHLYPYHKNLRDMTTTGSSSKESNNPYNRCPLTSL